MSGKLRIEVRMKKLLMLLVLVSICMLPLSAAGICEGGHFEEGQAVCENYEGDNPDVNVSQPNQANVANEPGEIYNNDVPVKEEQYPDYEAAEAAVEAEEEAANNTSEISTAGVIVQDMDALNLTEIDEPFFKKMQSEFLTYVQKVNWETNLRFTPRDSNGLMRMCKYVCYVGNTLLLVSSPKNADKFANKAEKWLEDASRARTCNRIMCLSIGELVRKVEVENPFILFAVDLETFQTAISVEPEVGKLYKNMFKFFKNRATMEGGDYNQNTEELLRLSELGEGNYFNTWEELARFSEHSKDLASKGQLNPKTERAAQIKILEVSMLHIADQTKVKKEVAKQLKKNPAYRAAANELKQNAKRPAHKERANDYINNNAFTVDEAAKWIRKY